MAAVAAAADGVAIAVLNGIRIVVLRCVWFAVSGIIQYNSLPRHKMYDSLSIVVRVWLPADNVVEEAEAAHNAADATTATAAATTQDSV